MKRKRITINIDKNIIIKTLKTIYTEKESNT